MAKKKEEFSSAPNPEYVGTFLEDYTDWNSPRLDTVRGGREKFDDRLGRVRGGNAYTGLRYTIDRLKNTLENTDIKQSTRLNTERDLKTAETMRKRDSGVRNQPTTISHISGQFSELLSSATNRAIEDNSEIPGTGWYFNHRRAQESVIDPSANLTKRQVTSMGGKLSAEKEPEDELASLRGISHLVSSYKNETINGTPIHRLSSEDLAKYASAASSWNAYESGQNKVMPDSTKPVSSSEDAYKFLIQAGRAHEANVAEATSIARGTLNPLDAFKHSTPKTSAYAEMQAQSDPDSQTEIDYRNVSAHYRDVVSGKVSKNQGMFMFSQEDAESPRPHALRSDVPTAIDTWMVAAGSGQPLSATRKMVDKLGRVSQRMYSPAKRLVDKRFPLDPTGYTKGRLGMENTAPNVTTEAAVSAQHNEAIRHISEDQIGAIGFDQTGKQINLPASLIQETVWTEARRRAGRDKAFNIKQRENKPPTNYQIKKEKNRVIKEEGEIVQGSMFPDLVPEVNQFGDKPKKRK